MTARPYQVEAKREAYRSLRRVRSALIVMPTGTGKGFLIGDVIADAVRHGKRVLAFVHREEIVTQLAAHAERATGTAPAIERAEFKEATDSSPVVVGSVPSLIKRLDRFAPDRFDLLIADEAHHALAASWRSLFDHFSGAKVLGFTATPNRGDERALGQVFNEVAYDLSMGEAVRGGWLVPIKTQTIRLRSLDLSKVRARSGDLAAGELGAVLSEIEVLREAIEPAVRIAGHMQAIVFCATRAHMHCVAETALQVAEEVGLELPISTVDGTTPSEQRRQIFDDFRAGRIRWLVNVGIATEGVDVPGVEAVIGLRPTLSRALYCQMGGRATRPLAGLVDGIETAEGRRQAIAESAKPCCLWLDFAGDSTRHDVSTPMDLLGGDYELPEQKAAAELLASGDCDNLIDALERARADREIELMEARARAGDPLALFGLTPSRDRWARPMTPGQARVLGALRSTRRLDRREANALLTELDRRAWARLCLYSQAALLVRVGVTPERLRSMPAAEASGLIRDMARRGWAMP